MATPMRSSGLSGPRSSQPEIREPSCLSFARPLALLGTLPRQRGGQRPVSFSDLIAISSELLRDALILMPRLNCFELFGPIVSSRYEALACPSGRGSEAPSNDCLAHSCARLLAAPRASCRITKQVQIHAFPEGSFRAAADCVVNSAALHRAALGGCP